MPTFNRQTLRAVEQYAYMSCQSRNSRNQITVVSNVNFHNKSKSGRKVCRLKGGPCISFSYQALTLNVEGYTMVSSVRDLSKHDVILGEDKARSPNPWSTLWSTLFKSKHPFEKG